MKIAHLQKLVFPMNVLIHVIESFADLELNAKLRLIELFATVLLVPKEILWCLVRKLGALPTLNVPLTKNVIISHPQALKKNVSLCV
jgi:hypothetical protein